MDQSARTAFTSGSSANATTGKGTAWIGVGFTHHPETAARHNNGYSRAEP